jgi:hypothetical protein
LIVRLPAHSAGSSMTRTKAVGSAAAVVARTGSGPRSNHASPGPSVCVSPSEWIVIAPKSR